MGLPNIVIDNSSLYAHYTSDNTYQDTSGNNRHLTPVGTPLYTADKDSVANRAFTSNGSIYYTLPFTLTTYSISFWIKQRTTVAVGGRISVGSTPNDASPKWVMYSQSDVNKFYDGGQDNTLNSYITDNVWQYFVITCQNNGSNRTVNLYINNVLRRTATVSGGNDGSLYLMNGFSGNAPISMDEIRIDSRVITDDERYILYTNGVNKLSLNTTTTDYDLYVLAVGQSIPTKLQLIADNTPPVWVENPYLTNATIEGADINATINEDGKIYYTVLTKGSTAPINTEIKNGVVGEILGGNFNATGNTLTIKTLQLLDVNTEYDLYLVAEDNAGNLQTDDKIRYLLLKTATYGIIPSVNITPAGGEYDEEVEITLDCSDPLATIYYTLNGSDPEETDFIYYEPFTITSTRIVKAKAYRTDYTPSAVTSEIYYIEGGSREMNEQQSAGLAALFWKPTGGTTETILGEVPMDGQEILSIQEQMRFYNTKYAGQYPTEARVDAGAATFTVDLIESAELRALLSNTTVTEGTKVIGGLNTGKMAKTGQLRIHPMYNGSDMSQDVILLKVAPAITDERTYAVENGRKLIKCVFTVMGVKTTLATPTVNDFASSGGTGSAVNYKMVNANDLGVSIASAAEAGKADNTAITFTPGTGANRVVFYKSTDSFVANASYYELTPEEVAAGTFNPSTVTWVASTVASVPAAATGYYYKAYEIGV